jgi:hypothetical protein
MSGRNFHGYQGRSGYRSPANSDGLFGWTVFIFLLIGFVFLCWMGSYYIFSHPEKPSNYRLLLKLHKIDPPQRFEITGAPRGEFLKPGQLLEHFGSMTDSELRRTNENLLRNFLRNYHQNRDLVPYAVGTYKVIGTMPLSEKAFASPGLLALLQAVEQPEIFLEQPFTCDGANLSALARSLSAGQEIRLEKPLDLSAVIHVDREILKNGRLLLTTMPLLYGSYGSAKGGTSFSLEPPQQIQLESGLPVLNPEQISDLSGGKLGKSQVKGIGLRLSRIREEETMPTPEPKVAKAQPAGTPLAKAASTPASVTQVARAVPVNVQPVLPAVPVATPPAPSVAAAIPVAAPIQPSAVAAPVSNPVPVPSPVIRQTPTPLAKPNTAPVAVATNPAVPPVATNQPADASQVWPLYAPGQMPRGRLVDPSDSEKLASRGIAGERHYIQGRFEVTAAGNGRAVLRPQGTIAGMSLGPSSRVRVIVEFPAGSTPPAEGGVISRDNLRPFQVTSVKRGDDGQVNIYAREVTRGE